MGGRWWSYDFKYPEVFAVISGLLSLFACTQMNHVRGHGPSTLVVVGGLHPYRVCHRALRKKNSNTFDLSFPNVTGSEAENTTRQQFLRNRYLVAVVYALLASSFLCRCMLKCCTTLAVRVFFEV